VLTLRLDYIVVGLSHHEGRRGNLQRMKLEPNGLGKRDEAAVHENSAVAKKYKKTSGDIRLVGQGQGRETLSKLEEARSEAQVVTGMEAGNAQGKTWMEPQMNSWVVFHPVVLDSRMSNWD
jgi:hypothetical protein